MADIKNQVGAHQGARAGETGGFRERSNPATEAASGVKDKAKDITQTAADMAGRAKEQAEEWASAAGAKLGDTKAGLGKGMEAFADKIRQSAPQEGTIGAAASAVADRVQSAGSYLQQHDLRDIGTELSGLIRRYPLATFLAGIGLGYCVSRAVRRHPWNT